MSGAPRAGTQRAPKALRLSRSSSEKGLHHPSRPRGATGTTPWRFASSPYSPLGSMTTARRPRQWPVDLHLDDRALARADRTGHDDVRVRYQARAVRIKHVKREKVEPYCASPRPSPASPVPASCAGRRRASRDRPTSPMVKILDQFDPPGSCARYHASWRPRPRLQTEPRLMGASPHERSSSLHLFK